MAVRAKRHPRKVKSSFSLLAPCVTSSRVDDGAPVAWQRRFGRGGREDTGMSIHSLFSSLLHFILPPLSLPRFLSDSAHFFSFPLRHPALSNVLRNPARHPFLLPGDFIPSSHSTHRQVAGATLIGPWQSHRVCPSAQIRERVEARKSILFESVPLLRYCILWKPSSSGPCPAGTARPSSFETDPILIAGLVQVLLRMTRCAVKTRKGISWQKLRRISSDLNVRSKCHLLHIRLVLRNYIYKAIRNDIFENYAIRI